MNQLLGRNRVLKFGVVSLLVAGTVGAAGALSAQASPSPASPSAAASSLVARGHGPKPTVVLVHGAFADSTGWNGVVRRLTRDGYPVVSAANPLRGVASDAAQVRALLDSIKGPIVLVGHSYGGMVISTAAKGDRDVKALVYVDAFAPKAGESALELSGLYPGSTLGDTLQTVPLPGGGTDVYIQPKLFPKQFAADLPLRDAALMAVAQRPVTLAALNEDAKGKQAWQQIPSWFVVGGADKNIPPAVQYFEAERAHGAVLTIPGASHVSFVSHPNRVASFIERAAH